MTMPRRKVASAPLEGRNARQLVRRLALGRETHAALAEEYGVTRQGVSAFATRHRERIEALKADANAALDGLWIADKAERVRAYERDVTLNDSLIDLARDIADRASGRAVVAEDALSAGDGDEGQAVLDQAAEDRLAEAALRDVPKLQGAKHKALRSVAEELGQLPAGTKVEVNDKRVQISIGGVDLADL